MHSFVCRFLLKCLAIVWRTNNWFGLQIYKAFLETNEEVLLRSMRTNRKWIFRQLHENSIRHLIFRIVIKICPFCLKINELLLAQYFVVSDSNFSFNADWLDDKRFTFPVLISMLNFTYFFVHELWKICINFKSVTC